MPRDLSQLSDEELDALERGHSASRPPRAPSRPIFTPLPSSPQQIAEDARNNAAAGRDAARTGISVRGEGRDINKTAFDQTKDLRNEFTSSPSVKAYQTIIRQYGNGIKAGQTPAGDQALINSYAQMLNPTSTVMQGEYDVTAQVDTTIARLQERLKKEFGWDGAGRISDDARNQLLNEMQALTENANSSYRQDRERYGDLAMRYGFDPEAVIGQHMGDPYWQQIHDSVEQRVQAKQKVGLGDDAGLTGTISDEAPSRPTPPPSDYRNSYLGQGMSGINEGIGNTFGLPVDVMAAVMNLAPQGINAVANTNLPTIDKPVGGSDWIKDRMSGWGTYAPTKDGRKQFVRRVGQSVGGALVPVAGTANTGRQVAGGLLSAAGGGVGGAAAQQAFPGNPMAEFAGELAGGGLTGAGALGLARRGAQRKIEAGIPTIDQLKDQAGQLYRQAESRGITADPTMTQQLADDMRKVLQDDGRISPTGRISEVYPKAKEAIQLADDYAGNTMTPTQLQTVRKVMADGMASPDPTERRTASMLTDTFDAWANPQAPELAQARDISSRYLNAQQLERARELAGARASQFSGSGFENALRTEYRGIDRNAIKGNGRYGPALKGAIENVSRGTPMSNVARNIGKLAPTGVVSAGLGTGAPAAVGALLAGPAGAVAAGGGAAALGTAGRVAATQMGIRNADIAELIARNGGPINQAPLVDDETQRAIAALLATQQGTLLRAPRKPKRKQR